MSRNEAPEKDVEVWPKLLKYAEEHNFVIDYHYKHKVEWMEKHGGVCFCDWQSGRVCPCKNVMSDMNKYNGQCLCGLLCTKERLEQKEKQRKNKKIYVVDKEKNKQKVKKTISLFNKIFKKR